MNLIKGLRELYFSFISKVKRFFYGDEANRLECFDLKTNLIENKYPKPLEEELSINQDLLDELNYLENLILTFSTLYEDKYKYYSKIIADLKTSYINSKITFENNLKRKNIILTTVYDPNINPDYFKNILSLHQEIDDFIQEEVRYKVIYNSLAELCCKLNILYKVSINLKNILKVSKLSAQIEKAEKKLNEIIIDIGSISFFSDIQTVTLRNLIAYVQYIIFKLKLRNEIFTEAYSTNKFFKSFKKKYNNLDLKGVLQKFLIEEIENLIIIVEKNQKKFGALDVLSALEKLQTSLLFESNEEKVFTKAYFQTFFKIEKLVFDLVVEKEKSDFFNLSNVIDLDKVNLTNVLTSIKREAIVYLSYIYNKEKKVKIELCLKWICSFKTEITYKELYFIFSLFEIYTWQISDEEDFFQVFKNNLNIQHERFEEKYSRENIRNKKILVFNIEESKKVYVKMLMVKENESERVKEELDNLLIDYIYKSNIVYLNYIYFRNFTNIQQNFEDKISAKDLLKVV